MTGVLMLYLVFKKEQCRSIDCKIAVKKKKKKKKKKRKQWTLRKRLDFIIKGQEYNVRFFMIDLWSCLKETKTIEV